MKVLVCGSRDFKDEKRLKEVLDDYDISEIIEGEARGADTLSRIYGENRGVPVRGFPARWDLYGNRAGPIRNSEMLEMGEPDVVVAFWNGKSKGTQNMIEIAKKKNIPVHVYGYAVECL